MIVRAGLRRADVAARPRASTARSYAFSPRSRGAPPRERGAFWRACVRCGRSRRACWRGSAVAFSNEQHRRRYAEDRKHREEKLAANRAYRAAHRDRLNAERRDKWRSDADLRARHSGARLGRKYGLSRESTGGCSKRRTASAPSASCHPGERSASIIATRRDRCAGFCATNATPRWGCSATTAGACGRQAPMSTARAAVNARGNSPR